MDKILRIVFFIATFATIIVFIWCHRVFCRRNEKTAPAPRLIIKKNWQRRRTRPASASPPHDHLLNQKRSSSYSPLISSDSSKPSPIGFKYTPDVSKINGVNGHINLPSTSGTSYPPKPENNRDSCSTTTSFYSSTQTPPYPLSNVIPHPSTSRKSAMKLLLSSRSSYRSESIRSETPDSTRTRSYMQVHKAPYPPSNVSAMPRPSSSRTSYSSEHTICEEPGSIRTTPYLPAYETPYPPQPSPSRSPHPPERNTRQNLDSTSIILYPLVHEAPYPLSGVSAMPQRSSLITPYPPECGSSEIQNFAKGTPYPPVHEAPYPPSNRTSLPQSSTITETEDYCRRTASYPSASSASLTVEQFPPSYTEAVSVKFLSK